MNNLEHSTIEHLAYQLWLERGCPEGSPHDDWFLAERKLRADCIEGETEQVHASLKDAKPL